MAQRNFLNSTISQGKSGDTIYVNINLTNPQMSTKAVNAVLNNNLQEAIIDKAEDYRIVVSNFSCSGRALPILYFETIPYPNTDIDLGLFSVVLTYRGFTTGVVNLRWLPETFTPPLVREFTPITPTADPSDPYYYNYSYSNISAMVTRALQDAIGLGGGFLPEGTDAYMTFNTTTGYYEIFGTQNMFNSLDIFDTENVGIWFNTPLAKALSGFKTAVRGYNSPEGLDELIIVSDNLNNTHDVDPSIPVGYYKIPFEFNADSNLQSLTRIVVTSPSFPVVAQVQVSAISSLQNSTTGAYDNIIFDFIPATSTANGSYRGKFQYFVQSEFFRRQLTAKGAIQDLQFNFLWEGINAGVLRPLVLEPCENLQLRIMFEKI